jgi:hypothetical protein
LSFFIPEIFRKRWQFEQEKRLEEQHGSPVDCSNEQWDEDWKKTMALASTTKSSESHVLNSLEEIHIFALANTLRRPILVLCDDVHRGNYDESLADVNLGGISLPLLCDSVDCIKSPIVIGYHQGHFTALVTTEDGSITGEDMFQQRRSKHVIPLVKYDESPMQLHFLLPDEQQSSDRLLREYLDCSKVEYSNNEVRGTILVAAIQSQEPEPHLDQMFKTYFETLQDVYLEKLAEKQLALTGYNSRPHPGNPPYNMEYRAVGSQNAAQCCSSHRRCRNTVCGNYTSRSSDYCHQCRKSKPPLCTSPGCTFTANTDYEGLCSTCFARYRALLEQGAEMPTPSAPPRNSCSNSNCSNEAGLHFNGICHNCYVKNIHHGNISVASSTPAEKQPTSTLNSEMENEDKFGFVSPSSQPFSRQNSRLFCFNQACNNPLQSSDLIYCNTCYAQLAPRNDVAGNKVCRISGCSSPAVTYHGELCYGHYHESIKNYHQKERHIPQTTQAGMKCITADCTFFGVPDHNYLCSRCHAKALQAQYDMEKMGAEQNRARRWSCEPLQRKPFYYEVNLHENISYSSLNRHFTLLSNSFIHLGLAKPVSNNHASTLIIHCYHLHFYRQSPNQTQLLQLHHHQTGKDWQGIQFLVQPKVAHALEPKENKASVTFALTRKKCCFTGENVHTADILVCLECPCKC